MKTATTKNTLLRWYLDQRAGRGDFETVNRDGMRLRQELECLTDSAKIGELMGPVSHEINNFMNAMMLQLSVVEPKMPEETRGELAAIREQAANAVAVLKQLRDCRRRKPRTPRTVDLHRTSGYPSRKSTGSEESAVPAAAHGIEATVRRIRRRRNRSC